MKAKRCCDAFSCLYISDVQGKLAHEDKETCGLSLAHIENEIIQIKDVAVLPF